MKKKKCIKCNRICEEVQVGDYLKCVCPKCETVLKSNKEVKETDGDE